MKFRGVMLAATVAVSLWAAVPAVQEAKKLVAAKKYDEAIAALEKAEKANPKAAEVKTALAETHVAQADSFMYNESLPPRMKYPQALRSYRKALEYDKNNKKAQSGVSTIEGIYKSMGRPVPQ